MNVRHEPSTQRWRSGSRYFKIWSWRSMLRVSWVERRTNDSILEEIGKTRELLRMIMRRQLEFLGHTLRREALENFRLTVKIAGSRG